MKEAVIFDFDGVIIDSEPLRHETYKKLFLKEFLIKVNDDKDIIGRKPEENISYFLKKYNLKGDVKSLINKRNELLKEVFSKKENIKPISGIFGFLNDLKFYKFKLAIASSSNKDYVNNILSLLKLNNTFNVIITGDMIKISKPNPEIFVKTANKLNKKPEDCIVIEDSLNGIIAAKAAGMKVIAITTSFTKEKLDLADLIIDNFDQIKVSSIQNIL